jgi:hypothetical protein
LANDNLITPDRRIHDQIIDAILEDWPEARTKGFFRALRSLPDASYVPEMLRNDPEWARWVSFIPDVWLIDAEKRHVVIFEAVHKHDISETKFARFSDLSWALDEDYYRLVMVRCDRFYRRAYDVQGASLCSELERIRAKLPSVGWNVPANAALKLSQV